MKDFKCGFTFHLIRYSILSGIAYFCEDVGIELRRTNNKIYVRISSIHEIDLTESQVCLIDMALYRGMSKQPLHLKTWLKSIKVETINHEIYDTVCINDSIKRDNRKSC